MESIQKLKDALIASEDVNGRSPDAIDPTLTTVGKAEFDALMSRLDQPKSREKKGYNPPPDNIQDLEPEYTPPPPKTKLNIASKVDSARHLLAYPDIDDNDYIVETLMKLLDVERGQNFVEYDCPEEGIHQAKDEILERIDKAKLSVLRGIHSGDKVANILVNLVEKVHEKIPLPAWECLVCKEAHPYDSFESKDPADIECPRCGSALFINNSAFILYDTDEFKEADAYVLRINTIRESKGKK